ncbi:54S ribosomal protein L8 [Physcia stellaris]|nr:54S ribosomal protein L8 [Physcia stellaris]
MAGGHLKHRHLGRKSSHRQALLRNLVTSLFTHESIMTTWPKAKEAQKLAEKVITMAKKNTDASRKQAGRVFYQPSLFLPTLFTTIRQRYLSRPGGYTRVLRVEPRNRNNDQAPSAILELIDGPRDMRFAMTAKTLVRERATEEGVREITARNVQKVTRFREGGMEELERAVKKVEAEDWKEKTDEDKDEKR